MTIREVGLGAWVRIELRSEPFGIVALDKVSADWSVRNDRKVHLVLALLSEKHKNRLLEDRVMKEIARDFALIAKVVWPFDDVEVGC